MGLIRKDPGTTANSDYIDHLPHGLILHLVANVTF